MTCHNCTVEMVKAGKGRNGMQRFKCQQRGKRFQEAQQRPFGAESRLPKETECESFTTLWKATACAEPPASATWRSGLC